MSDKHKILGTDVDLPEGWSVKLSPDQIGLIVDVDKSWDGTGSLDDHRQNELKNLTQPGFGNIADPS